MFKLKCEFIGKIGFIAKEKLNKKPRRSKYHLTQIRYLEMSLARK